jgi:hypothetical protein
MNIGQILYPYVLSALNMLIGWLSYTLFTPEFGIPFLVIGLLVCLAVISQTVRPHIPGTNA